MWLIKSEQLIHISSIVAVDVSREARQYVDRLLGNGHAVPVDEGYDTYVQELPEWYDDVKFKR